MIVSAFIIVGSLVYFKQVHQKWKWTRCNFKIMAPQYKYENCGKVRIDSKR